MTAAFGVALMEVKLFVYETIRVQVILIFFMCLSICYVLCVYNILSLNLN